MWLFCQVETSGDEMRCGVLIQDYQRRIVELRQYVKFWPKIVLQ